MHPDPTPITLVLPGDGRSGGVRVTVIMANLLRKRGYTVRIACRRNRIGIRARMSLLFSGLGGKRRNAGFLHEFDGRTEHFDALDELTYQPGEIVIAVGTYTVAAVRQLRAPVVKARFNHGFPAKPDAEQERAWQGPMPTITVSNTLVPRLQELTNGCVWGVVPNGIDLTQYSVQLDGERRGVGALFNRHPNKAPEDLLAVLQKHHRLHPSIPQHVFSTERCPTELRHANFTRLPSVAEARAIYNRCKVWVLTSLTEGLPGVVLEAMACGCVVVSSDNQGSLEILRHEHNGLVVPRRDIAGFVAAIDRVMADEPLRRRLAAASLSRVREFSWDRAADRMEAFLRELPELHRGIPAQV